MSVKLSDFYPQLTAALSSIDGFGGRIHLGHVPDDLPTDAWDRVLPYVAVWPLMATPVDDRPAAGVVARSAVEIPFQTTVVAPTVEVLLDAVDATAETLTGHQIGAGQIVPDDSQADELVLKDPDVTPTRFFTPLRWRITTQHIPTT